MACSFPTNQAIVVGGDLAGMSAANTVVEDPANPADPNAATAVTTTTAAASANGTTAASTTDAAVVSGGVKDRVGAGALAALIAVVLRR